MAIGLMLVMEGVMPFVSPLTWRETFKRMIALTDGQLRFLGLASMLVGLSIVLMVS